MNVLDVNVLVALFHAEHQHHVPARAWWDASTLDEQPFTVPDAVVTGFLRVVTSSRALTPRPTPRQAWEFVDTLFAQPTYLAFAADPRTVARFRTLCSMSAARGDLISDAYIAACAATYGGTVVTFDRDFRRFDGIRVLELTA